MVKKLFPNFCLVLNIFTIKAALVSNFCLIGKIHHDFLVPSMIELGCKTFMPFQTSDLHRVCCTMDRPAFFNGVEGSLS